GTRVKLDVERDLRVRGDRGRLRQVFANLLSNAAEAQREGEVELAAKKADGNVVVTVRDHGPGVPEKARARIFDPFFTLRAGGTGLGLAIVRRHVERHGGAIKLVDSAG